MNNKNTFQNIANFSKSFETLKKINLQKKKKKKKKKVCNVPSQKFFLLMYLNKILLAKSNMKSF